MLTGSTDRSILATDVETGATIARLEDSHEDAIYSLINVTESTVASGDDQGCIKVVFFPNTRQRTLCNSFDAHKEYVSDMTFAADAMKLLGTSVGLCLSLLKLLGNSAWINSNKEQGLHRHSLGFSLSLNLAIYLLYSVVLMNIAFERIFK
ncbi:hypothetical protein KPL70_009235 [Citrus sinensis]|nr:hypothetical protein KPL70_019700 [Citrus sinensis]KAH9728518.1 hypothetical protein KPL70_009062 [Citrus sinensis]KAH9729030.1 hypothetical protein KPL70_009235 [Citrus sinensis]